MTTWDTSRVFLHIQHYEPRFDSHITNLTRHQLLIKYDPPISVSNPTSSKPTRLGVDFQFFYNSYDIPNPTRSAIDPLNLTQQPIITTYYCQYHENHDYTPQSTFKPPKITPEHDPIHGSESRLHKTFLGFFTLKPRAQIHLKSINPKSHSLTQNTTNPKK
jgi:hypothetical protein